MQATITIPVIKTCEDRDNALKRIIQLSNLDPQPDTPESDELTALLALVDKWENTHIMPKFDFSDIDAIDHILFYMDQNGLKNKDMIPYFGSPSRASEILNRKRTLTIPMIKKLHKELGIPLALLIEEPETEKTST